jgi:hypothetical protein
LSVSNSIGAGSSLTTFISAARTNFLDTIAWGILPITIGGTVVPGDYLQLTTTKTTGAVVSVSVTNTATGVTLSQFIQTFMNAINATASLQGSDGLVSEDLTQADATSWTFNLRALSVGLAAAQIQGAVLGTFTISPIGSQALTNNLSDLQPRNHLFITTGQTNLPITYAFNTTALADGFHELTAVAYEGSSVHTQQRAIQTVRIQNTSLSATFTTLFGGTNTAIEAILQFSIVASTNAISKIELFSTGGSLTNVTGQSSVTFSVPGSSLGIGLHPFYAIVTATTGKQYRTETKWIRLVGTDSPFVVAMAAHPPALAWPASAGRSYDILSATNLTNAFQLRTTLVPSNSAAYWQETNATAPQRFYRVRTSY